MRFLITSAILLAVSQVPADDDPQNKSEVKSETEKSEDEEIKLYSPVKGFQPIDEIIPEAPPEPPVRNTEIPRNRLTPRRIPATPIPRNRIPQNRLPANRIEPNPIPKRSIPNRPLPKRDIERNPLKQNRIKPNPLPRNPIPRNRLHDTSKAPYNEID